MVDKTHNGSTAVEKVVWVGLKHDKTQQKTAPIETPFDLPAETSVEDPITPPPIAEPETKIPAADDIVAMDQSRVLAQTVISTFTNRLKAEASKCGGQLATEDIDQLAQEFEHKREALETVFQESFQSYFHIRERAAFDHARNFPFDRIIVNTFAKLFDQDRVAEDGPRAVTRYVLAGFFMALEKMIGPEAMEVYQERSRIIVYRVSGGDENELDWAKIYAYPDSKELCFDALVAFAPYFADIHKRQEWFLPIVNNNLAANSSWVLTEGGFHNLIGEMFSELRDALADPETRQTLEQNYGGATCFELDRAFDQMDQGT